MEANEADKNKPPESSQLSELSRLSRDAIGDPPEISDGDQVFDRDATVDRMARPGPSPRRAAEASPHEEESWGFRIRHWLHLDP